MAVASVISPPSRHARRVLQDADDIAQRVNRFQHFQTSRIRTMGFPGFTSLQQVSCTELLVQVVLHLAEIFIVGSGPTHYHTLLPSLLANVNIERKRGVFEISEPQ